MKPRVAWRRYVGPKRMLAMIALVALMLWTRQMEVDFASELQAFIGYTAARPLTTALMFFGVYVFSVIALIPTLPLNLLAGMIWGPWFGGVMAGCASTSGAAVTFLVARSMLGDIFARRFDNEMVTRVQQEFETKGWLFVGLMRINPVFPTGILNYVLGLTSIRFRPYLAATAVFLLPPSVVIAWIGKESGSLVLAGTAADRWNSVLIVSACATVLLVGRYVAKLVRPEYPG